LGIITARGGSKGIPGKNTREFAGKPLIAWTIEASLASEELTDVIVSTDDEEIARVSREWGAEVPFLRPSPLAKDDTPHIPVVLHAVKWLQENQDRRPEYVLLLQPTSPLRTCEDIDNAIRLAYERDADGVVAVCEVDHHPYVLKRLSPDGHLLEYCRKPEGYLRRQDFPPVYAVNGAVYLVRRSVLMARRTWYTSRTYPYIMPPKRSMDIDTPWQFRLAEFTLKHRLADENHQHRRS